jgi:parallel beta-helix repeat protein
MEKQMQERPSAKWLLIGLILLCAPMGFAADVSFSSWSDMIAAAGPETNEQTELLVQFVDRAGVPVSCPDLVGPRTTASKREAISDRLVKGASVERNFDKVVTGLTVVKLPKGTSTLNAVLAFSTCADVVFAEPNYKYQLCRVPQVQAFASQWDMNNVGQTGGLRGADISAVKAWDTQTGSRNVIVAILDTGIDLTHPALSANIWTNAAEAAGKPGVDDDGNGYIDDIHGYDFINNTANPKDDVYHGTYVAGIIGASGQNSAGVAGVCWNVSLMPLKVADANGVSLSAAVAAIEYAVANGARIINASWAGSDYSESLKQAIEAAQAKGVLFVASAGNGSKDIDANPVYPACYDLNNIISVLATNSSDKLAWSSNYGRASVDIGEPGEGVVSTLPTYKTQAMTAAGLSTNYGSISGTSVSAPHVSGAAALLLSQSSDMSFYQLKLALMSTADKVTPGLSVSQGRLNLAVALAAKPTGNGTRAVIVKSAPATTYPTIQAAINAANPGDEIIISGQAGVNTVYTERIDFKGKAITVRSGNISKPGDPNIFPATTFIVSPSTGTGSVVTFANGEDRNSVLKGLTIGWGAAQYGGGISCTNASPTITQCIITNNQATDNGGGIDCYGGSPLIEKCTISSNSVTDASGSGAGIDVFESAATITGCTISNNSSQNVGGGVSFVNTSGSLFNCFLLNNSAVYGYGQVDVYDASPAISHCTIVSDVTVPGNGGIWTDGDLSNPTITSCILWGNGDELYGCSATYSCIEDSDAGAGNVHTAPQFVQGPGGAYYLSQVLAGQTTTSPCVDAANPSLDAALAAELHGKSTRTDGMADSGTLDIGAHYSTFTAERFPLSITVLTSPANDPNAPGGTVDPNTGSFRKYEMLTLAAHAKAGYRFKAWFGLDNEDVNAASATITFPVLAAVDVMAIFEKIPSYKLTTGVVHGHGEIVPFHSRGQSYLDGTVVTLTAKPEAGYIVDKWTGTNNDKVWSNTNTITIHKNTEVLVQFRQPKSLFVP